MSSREYLWRRYSSEDSLFKHSLASFKKIHQRELGFTSDSLKSTLYMGKRMRSVSTRRGDEILREAASLLGGLLAVALVLFLASTLLASLP